MVPACPPRPRPPLQEFHYLWTAPLEAAAILALLANLTGDSMLPGLGVILLVLPLQYVFGYKIIQIKMEWAKHAATRSGVLQEVLPAIKLVKYYAWEKHFEEEINKVRPRVAFRPRFGKRTCFFAVGECFAVRTKPLSNGTGSLPCAIGRPVGCASVTAHGCRARPLPLPCPCPCRPASWRCASRSGTPS